jgi:hypothetical protein
MVRVAFIGPGSQANCAGAVKTMELMDELARRWS